MVRCPVCESVQIGFLLSPRPTTCFYCKATWLQDGSEQMAVQGVHHQSDDDAPRTDDLEPTDASGGRTEWTSSSV